jgi:hypothetical protein
MILNYHSVVQVGLVTPVTARRKRLVFGHAFWPIVFCKQRFTREIRE